MKREKIDFSLFFCYNININRNRKEKQIEMKEIKVVSGKYKGREGKADFQHTKKTGNVMFYPVEGSNPYRVVLSLEEIEVIE